MFLRAAHRLAMDFMYMATFTEKIQYDFNFLFFSEI